MFDFNFNIFHKFLKKVKSFFPLNATLPRQGIGGAPFNTYCFILLLSVGLLIAKTLYAEKPTPQAEKPTPQAEEFQLALPGYSYKFPRDLFSHDNFRIEWWYYTGNLEDETGRPFGYQLTFFRVGLEGSQKFVNDSKWKVDQIYFAHFTVSDIENEKFHYFERINRKGLGNAGAESDRLEVWNENWSLTLKDEAHVLTAHDSEIGINLSLLPEKPPVIHGMDGVSVKGEQMGNASHYFSYTRMKTTGTVTLKGTTYKIRGTSWMDHEFSSSQMNAKQSGWDWFSLKFDNGHELMLYQLRLKTGGVDSISSGTLVLPDGSHRHLNVKDFTVVPQGTWTSQKTSARYPSGWKLQIQDPPITLKVRPDMKAQELDFLRSISGSYWEGSVTAQGIMEGKSIKGKGYVELVGYQNALKYELPK